MKSRDDATSSGWGWLIFGCLLALFVGGAVRGLLSPQRWRLWIDETLRAERPPFEMHFDSVELSLKNGLFPRFGIRLHGLNLIAKDPCRTGAELKVEELFVPVSLREALAGRFYVRHIQARDVDLTLGAHACDGSEAPAVTTPLALLDQFFKTRMAQELENTRKRLAGIELQNLRIKSSPQGSPVVTVSYLKLDMGQSGGKARAQARVEVSKDLLATPLIPSAWVELSADDDVVEWSLRGLYREGLLESQGRIEIANAQVSWTAQFKHFPIQPFYERIRQAVPQLPPLRQIGAWLSCQAKGTSRVAQILADELRAQDCFIEGDIGRISMASAQFFVFPNLRFNPLSVVFEKVHLDQLWGEQARNLNPWFDIRFMGPLRGVLDVDVHSGRFKGQIGMTEIGVWRSGLRARQIILQSDIDAEVQATSVQLNVTQIEQANSHVEGAIQLNFANDELQHSDLKLSRLHLDDSIVQLFLPGSVDPVSLEFRQRGSQVEGKIRTARIESPLFRAYDVAVEFAREDDSAWRGTMQTAAVESSARPIVRSLESILPVDKLTSIRIEKLQADWTTTDRLLGWDNFRFWLPSQKMRFVSLGELDAESEIVGLLVTHVGDQPTQRFRMIGQWPRSFEFRAMDDTRGRERLLKRLDQQLRQPAVKVGD